MTRHSQVRGRDLTRFEALSERVAMSSAGYRYLLHLAPRIDKFLLPRTEGVWGSAGKNAVALVTTTGAKTGKERSQPLVALPQDDGSLLLIGSNYGRPWHPAWSHNLLAHPECDVTFAGETKRYTARQLEGDEREAEWTRAVDWYAGYAAYAENARPRQIRLFRLEPTS